MHSTSGGFSRLSFAILALVAVFVLMSADDALGRAGGGHSSSGSSSSSYGSSSSGSSSSGSNWNSSGADGSHPVPLSLMLSIFGLFFLGFAALAVGSQRRERKTRDSEKARRHLELVAKLQAKDAAFDFNGFSARARDGFTKLQRAWCEQSLTAVRPFISDGIHERFSLQFEEQRALGYRAVMEKLSITEITLAQVECGPVFDVLTLRIAASAKDYRVSAETGQAIPGSEEPADFAEYWSFIRARGSATKPGASGLIEGNCPNCGAPIAMNQGAKCEYCEATLRSGQYDWVLAEITQDEEWHPSLIPPPGAQTMSQRDPGFNLQDLEDVTSVIFWRKAAADRLGRVDPVRKVAAPEWCDAYASRLQAASGLTAPHIFCDCAVSAVRTEGVILGEAEDRALVVVRWMGREFEVAPAGQLHALSGEMIMQRSLFVLGRKAGVATTAEHSISSAHCPSCGGAVTADTSNACEFCHATLNDGTRSWVLRDIIPMGSPEAVALTSAAQAGGAAEPRVTAPAEGAAGAEAAKASGCEKCGCVLILAAVALMLFLRKLVKG